MSSGSANGGGDSSIYIFLGVLVLLVLRRFTRVIRGSKVSRGRTVAFSIYYLGFAALLIAVSIAAGGVSPDYVALYVVVGAVGVYGAYHFADKRIGFWKTADGSIWYRGAIEVYILYVAALITRIVIDLAFIGPSAFSFGASSAPTDLSTAAVDAGIVVDVLLALGSGLLTGRNLRVMKRYSAIMAGQEQVGDTPPKISLF